jgi:hypothetical protein
MDMHNNTSSHEEKVNFVDKTHIEFEVFKREITTNEGKKKARFLIRYVLYPKASSFIWYNPKNEIATTDEHVTNRTKYDVSILNGEILFDVKKPSIDDFGDYTLVVNVDGEEHREVVSLVVTGKLLEVICFEHNTNCVIVDIN